MHEKIATSSQQVVAIYVQKLPTTTAQQNVSLQSGFQNLTNSIWLTSLCLLFIEGGQRCFMQTFQQGDKSTRNFTTWNLDLSSFLRIVLNY